jgi:hypothetical protein
VRAEKIVRHPRTTWRDGIQTRRVPPSEHIEERAESLHVLLEIGRQLEEHDAELLLERRDDIEQVVGFVDGALQAPHVSDFLRRLDETKQKLRGHL